MGLATNGSCSAVPALKFLIYGRTGWIGGLLGRQCEEHGISYVYGTGRLENRSQLEDDIETAAATHVFNAAGVTGRPNVDWCESHKVETIRANVVGTLTLADLCRERGLVLINYATGCIFEYDDAHQLGSEVGFKEEETPNFVGSFYSKIKAMVSSSIRSRSCSVRKRRFGRPKSESPQRAEPQVDAVCHSPFFYCRSVRRSSTALSAILLPVLAPRDHTTIQVVYLKAASELCGLT